MARNPLKSLETAKSKISPLNDFSSLQYAARSIFASFAKFSLRNAAFWTQKVSPRNFRRSAEHANDPVADRRPGRIAAIDVARGLALLGMVVYHLSWDLAYFGLARPDLPYSPGMRVYSHIVACAFLGLVGVSLAIAHRDGPRWRAFFRRLAIVVGAAALVSVATLLAAPDEPIWFGILACIAAASLLAAPFLRAPAWASLVAGAVALAAPRVLAGAAFNPPALVWLGLGTEDPSTLDWRPLLPWAGVTLIGLGLTRLALPQLLASKLARWRPGAAGPSRWLSPAGTASPSISSTSRSCSRCCSRARNCPARRRGMIASATSQRAGPPASNRAAKSRPARGPANASRRRLKKRASSLR